MSALTSADYLEFLKLKIPREIIDRAGIFRIDSVEANRAYQIHLDCDGGLCFPYFLPPLNGNDVEHPVAYSVRQDAPKYDHSGKAARKYVATPGRQYPYIAPVANQEWFADPSVAVIIVEAQKSALAVLRWAEDHGRRFIPVGIAGCYGWRGVTGIAPNEKGEREEVKGLNPGLAAICRNHRVYVLLDQNAATNPHVQRGREWLVETLLREGITNDVRILNLPPSITEPRWNGPDDFLGVAGDEAFHEIFEEARRFQPESKEAELFHTPEECENVPDITFSIAGFLQDDGMTFIGGLSGHAKTWIALSIVKALLIGEGTKLWELFPVNQTAARVIYLIPEVGLSSFMSRARRMGLLPFIRERRLLVRTLSKGPAPDLNDARMLAAVKGAHVVLDTAARFADGEENSASDNARGLAADIFGLLTAGARSVICAHHSPKSFLKENSMSLEGILRGTGDIGAMATTVWGVKQLDEPQNIVYIECVKARDFTHCQPFQIHGRPCIDESGDFKLYRAPGESGSLAEEQPAPANESKQRERDDRLAMVRSWLISDPNMSATEMVEKFRVLGITVKPDTVFRYRKEARKNG